MLRILILINLVFALTPTWGANPKYGQISKEKDKNKLLDKEARFIELKAKKEFNDKKSSTIKKYTTAILAARELKNLKHKHRALEFYKMAQEIKIDLDKMEIKEAIKSKGQHFTTVNPFYFDVDIKELIKSHAYEKAILALNPDSFEYKENEQFKIIYDLLNVKIKKTSVKKLYCLDHIHKDLEYNNYENILCNFLVEYLKEGKKDSDHLTYVEDYFLKKDLNERYLLEILKDI